MLEEGADPAPLKTERSARRCDRQPVAVHCIFGNDADGVALRLQVERERQDPRVGVFAGLVDIHYSVGCLHHLGDVLIT